MTPREAIELAIDEAHEFGMLDEPTEAFRAALRLLLWQPIETAPVDAEILLSDGSYVFVGACYVGGPIADNVRRYWSDSEGRDIQPTHWMPLPAAPNPGVNTLCHGPAIITSGPDANLYHCNLLGPSRR